MTRPPTGDPDYPIDYAIDYAIVIPTIGRPSLDRLLASLTAQHACAEHPRPTEVLLIDDRRSPATEPAVGPGPFKITVRRSGGRGPAAARNVGWRSVRASWVVFLDDDVELPADWSRLLCADLTGAAPFVAGNQAQVRVPLPADRRPTDWERNTAGLADARWATADMAYRRAALAAVGGFDERFGRAYREDADLALRIREAGWRLARGNRTTVHPVRPADPWVSVRAQVGAGDDALMRRLHGRQWRHRAQTGHGRFPVHLITVLLTIAAGALTVLRRRGAGVLCAAAATGLTVDFAARRVAAGPSPRTAAGCREAVTMVITSVLIPPAAVWHRLRGLVRHRAAGPWPVPLRAVLFDRDGTLVRDVPYNGDPDRVVPMPDARATVLRLRRRNLRIGVVSNQSGIGRGLLSWAEVSEVNRRVEHAVGPFDCWQVCPHAPDLGCGCRKPEPGMILDAARELGVAGYECVVVGDIGADVEAAIAAGAHPVLVPTTVTRSGEIDSAPVVARSLAAAADLILTPGSA